jgi:hypothetical protein
MAASNAAAAAVCSAVAAEAADSAVFQTQAVRRLALLPLQVVKVKSA